MRVLDLFAGLCGWSQPFAERGHEVFSVDLDERFDVSLHADILTLTAGDLPWRPDIILASPPCEAFSVMTIGRNWAPGRVAKTDKARIGVALVEATRRLIDDLSPTFFVVENPRAMLRKLPALSDLERRTVTYCQYGEPFMKPTDLWGGFPPSLVLRPMCRKLAPCHVAAPRGSRTGIQGPTAMTRWRETVEVRIAAAEARGDRHLVDLIEYNVRQQEYFGTANPREVAALRAKIPAELALAVCLAAERDLEAGAGPIPATIWQVSA